MSSTALRKRQLSTAWHHFDHKSSLSRTFSKFADTMKSTSSASSGRFLLKKPSCKIKEWAFSFLSVTEVNLGEDEDDGEEEEDPAESGHQVDPPGIKTMRVIFLFWKKKRPAWWGDRFKLALGQSQRHNCLVVVPHLKIKHFRFFIKALHFTMSKEFVDRSSWSHSVLVTVGKSVFASGNRFFEAEFATKRNRKVLSMWYLTSMINNWLCQRHLLKNFRSLQKYIEKECVDVFSPDSA